MATVLNNTARVFHFNFFKGEIAQICKVIPGFNNIDDVTVGLLRQIPLFKAGENGGQLIVNVAQSAPEVRQVWDEFEMPQPIAVSVPVLPDKKKARNKKEV